jgi:predicted nucleic acid-binding protein
MIFMEIFPKNGVLVDSNILIYALNRSSPKYNGAREFIEKYHNSVYIAHQNIWETLRIVTHPTYIKSQGKIKANLAEKFVNQLNVISPLNSTYFLTIDLIKKYNVSLNSIFDSYLVATMLTHNIDTIVTDNERDFGEFQEIKVYNPFK